MDYIDPSDRPFVMQMNRFKDILRLTKQKNENIDISALDGNGNSIIATAAMSQAWLSEIMLVIENDYFEKINSNKMMLCIYGVIETLENAVCYVFVRLSDV